MTNKHRIENDNGLSRRGFVKSLFGSAIIGLPLLKFRKTPSPLLAGKIFNGSVNDEAYWLMVRRQFDLTDDYIYMNNGTQGPSPRVVLDKMERVLPEIASNPGNYYHLYDEANDNRKIIADFIGCTPEELAITHNTTEGMNFAASGLELKAGDEVLITDHEHPGGLCPWQLKAKKFGIKITEVPVGSPPENKEEILNRFNDAITSRTKVISISHICYTNSLLMPVKELCKLAREKGIISVVDGAHPFGMIALNMHEIGCDFYAASGQKWMMGPMGTGIFYARKESQDLCCPTIVTGGWDREKTAKRYEKFSTRSLAGLLGLGEAVKFQHDIGKVRIEERIRALSGYFRKNVAQISGIKLYTSQEPCLSAGLTTIGVKNYPLDKLINTIRKKYKIWPRTVKAHDLAGLRFSFHIYNNFKDVDRAIEVLDDICKNGI